MDGISVHHDANWFSTREQVSRENCHGQRPGDEPPVPDVCEVAGILEAPPAWPPNFSVVLEPMKDGVRTELDAAVAVVVEGDEQPAVVDLPGVKDLAPDPLDQLLTHRWVLRHGVGAATRDLPDRIVAGVLAQPARPRPLDHDRPAASRSRSSPRGYPVGASGLHSLRLAGVYLRVLEPWDSADSLIDHVDDSTAIRKRF